MSSNNELRIELTSSVIPASSDGSYPFQQISFLFPHEPLRRELNRGKIAMQNTKTDEHPWKMKYIHKWLTEFLIPVIYDHHEAEDSYFFPDYRKLGVVIPEHVEQGHEKLLLHLTQMEKLSGEMADFIAGQKETDAIIKFNQLKYLYCEKFHPDVVAHLADEETFWPPVIQQYGEEKYNEINKALHKYTRDQKTAKLFIMSVLDAMGYEFDLNNRTHNTQYDTRWCGEQMLNDKIINKIPYLVRAWILPSYNRKYQYYKKLITTVAYGTDDAVPLEFSGGYCAIC
jgi:hemerythrin superfamily protein